MGVNLPAEETIAGFKLAQIKKSLQALDRTGNPTNFLHIKGLQDRVRAAVLLEGLQDRGLVQEDALFGGLRLSEGGKAFITGKTSRSSLPVAQAVLERFLDQVELGNTTMDPLDLVDKVWLFGSVMREEETVGDIDLAIETVRNPVFEDEAKFRQRLTEVTNMAPASLNYFNATDWHGLRAVFGERRHPLLAGAHIGARDLILLGVPCRLVWDRSRGGRVNDPILPRHPDSPGRSNTVPAPRKLPNLRPPDVIPAPMNAKWLSSYSRYGRETVSHKALISIDDPDLDLNYSCQVLTDDIREAVERVAMPAGWVPNSYAEGGFDGRKKVLLAYSDVFRDPENEWAASVILQRSYRAQDDGKVGLTFELSGYESQMKFATEDSTALQTLIKGVSALACGDYLRQVFHQLERNGEVSMIELSFDAQQLPEPLQCPVNLLLRATVARMVSVAIPEYADRLVMNEVGSEYEARLDHAGDVMELGM